MVLPVEEMCLGHVSLVYGCIQELWTGYTPEAENRNHVIRENTLRVLAELPEDEEWPPLLRQMFAVSDGDITMTFWGRTIHFAASIKTLDNFLREWMDKFENLLKQLHWCDAFLHFKGMHIGHHDFSWRPARKWMDAACDFEIPLQPVDSWEFTSTFPVHILNEMTSSDNRNNRYFDKKDDNQP